MWFIASDVLRKGNQCAETLTNVCLASNHLTVWLDIPDIIRETFVQNKLGMDNFSFENY